MKPKDVLDAAVCLWFFRVFEACKDEVFGCRRLRVLQYRVNGGPQDCRAQVEEHTAAGHAVVRVEPIAGFECEEDVPTFDGLRDTAIHEAFHLLFSDYSRLALYGRRTRGGKWNGVLKAEHEIMDTPHAGVRPGRKIRCPVSAGPRQHGAYWAAHVQGAEHRIEGCRK